MDNSKEMALTFAISAIEEEIEGCSSSRIADGLKEIRDELYERRSNEQSLHVRYVRGELLWWEVIQELPGCKISYTDGMYHVEFLDRGVPHVVKQENIYYGIQLAAQKYAEELNADN